jgi:heme exporter protein A
LILKPNIIRKVLAANIQGFLQVRLTVFSLPHARQVWMLFQSLQHLFNLSQHSTMVLRAENLQKKYDRRCIFEQLSFELRLGDSLAIQGANGSGKSTLMRLLAGVSTPTQGRITYLRHGQALEKTEQIRYIGFVAPYLQFYDDLTGLENVLFSLRAKGITPNLHQVESLFEHFALATACRKFVRTYSSGMTQRLRFVHAFAAAPIVYLLDEPTVTLDRHGIALLWDYVAQQRPNIILIVASNDADDIAQCQHRLCIEDFKPKVIYA